MFGRDYFSTDEDSRLFVKKSGNGIRRAPKTRLKLKLLRLLMYCYCNYKLKIKNKEELKIKRTSFYFPFLLYIYTLDTLSLKIPSIVIKDGKVQDSLQERGEKQFDRSRFTQGWLKFTLRTVERLQSLHNLLNGS